MMLLWKVVVSIFGTSVFGEACNFTVINITYVDYLFQFSSSFFRSQDTHGPELILPASIEFRESCE